MAYNQTVSVIKAKREVEEREGNRGRIMWSEIKYLDGVIKPTFNAELSELIESERSQRQIAIAM